MASLIGLLFFLAIRSVCSVIPDYCYKPLNTSDCGREPVPVFYYYKPRSRCEIGFWKGCPTKNIFTNEFKCSHMCIGKLDKDTQDVYKPNYGFLDNTIWTECYITPISRVCTNEKTERYTYNKLSGQCEPITWYGCQAKNIHINQEECEIKCLRKNRVPKNSNDLINDNDIKEINKILEDTIDNVECLLLGTPCDKGDNNKEVNLNDNTKEKGNSEDFSYYTDLDNTEEKIDPNKLDDDENKNEDKPELFSTKASETISTDDNSQTYPNKDTPKASKVTNTPESHVLHESTTTMKVLSSASTEKLPESSTRSSVTEKADSSPSSITEKTDTSSSRVTKKPTSGTKKTRKTGKPNDFVVQTPDPASEEYPFHK